jgi:hypothetical protein
LNPDPLKDNGTPSFAPYHVSGHRSFCGNATTLGYERHQNKDIFTAGVTTYVHTRVSVGTEPECQHLCDLLDYRLDASTLSQS